MAFNRIMSGTAWRVITTASKEFWLPFSLALGLALWGVSGEKFHQIQGYFFGFLMIAWFTGQIVRIKREIERKDSTKATIDRLTALSEKLDHQFKLISGHATGGDSYITVYPNVSRLNGDIEFGTSVEGDFAVRSVDIVMQNIDAELPWQTATHDYQEVIWPRILRTQCHWPANGQERHRCLIQLSALNHTTYCEAVVDRNLDGKFVLAYRQTGNNRSWVYSIPADFPKNDISKPELLFKFEIPAPA